VSEIRIRRATPADTPGLAATLARAFYDDPVMTWAIPGDSRRLERAQRFFTRRLESLLPQEEVYAESELRAAALWALPGRWHVGLLEGLRLLAPAGLRNLPRVARGFQLIEEVHPTEPHVYLATLGTDPDFQGQGLGSQVLQPELHRCDSEGIPAYLESSKERNVAFYGRHGFRVTGELDIPGGPRVWLMWREPMGSAPPPGA
jgi:ribosomal protein S18 acetylase RimI-like enzyme